MGQKMKGKLKNCRGFTLIELIVVIAIIAILAAVLIPRFTGFTKNAREKSTISDARNIAIALESLTALNKTFISAVSPETTTDYSEGEVMGYMGKATGGQLTFTVASGAVTSFDYVKQFGSEFYSVTYTASTGAFSDVTSVAGPITATVLDTTFE